MVDEKYLIVIVVVALLFGAGRLPGLARNLALGIKEFRHGLDDAIHDDEPAEGSSPPPGKRGPSS